MWHVIKATIFFWVITFFSHQLPAIANMAPWTDTSTKREHPTTNFTYFAPFRQFNSWKDLNTLTQIQKWHKCPQLF